MAEQRVCGRSLHEPEQARAADDVRDLRRPESHRVSVLLSQDAYASARSSLCLPALLYRQRARVLRPPKGQARRRAALRAPVPRLQSRASLRRDRRICRRSAARRYSRVATSAARLAPGRSTSMKASSITSTPLRRRRSCASVSKVGRGTSRPSGLLGLPTMTSVASPQSSMRRTVLTACLASVAARESSG